MRSFIATLFVLLIALPAYAVDYTMLVPTNKCSSQISIVDGDNWYWNVGERSNAEAAPVSIFFDRDNTGDTATGQTLTLYACTTAEDPNTCSDLLWDSDGDGTPDTNVLTGASAATAGLTNISGFPFLRVEETGTASALARYVVCRSI